MPIVIKGKVDLAKIHGVQVVKKDGRTWLNLDKAGLFEGKNGAIYLDFAMFETPDSKYGDDYRVTQDLPKALRDKGVRAPILGNAKNKMFGEQAQPAQPPASDPRPAPNVPSADDDVPF